MAVGLASIKSPLITTSRRGKTDCLTGKIPHPGIGKEGGAKLINGGGEISTTEGRNRNWKETLSVEEGGG